MEINFIACNNQEELIEVLEYAWLHGKKGLQSFKQCENKFPTYISMDEEYLGWTNSGNRAANYIEYKEWKTKC